MLTTELNKFVEEHIDDDVQKLALQADKYPSIDIPFVIQQISGRKIARDKIPSWYNTKGIIYPKHLSMEQCSSEHTARYKSELFYGNSMVDLTGGFGIDIAFLATRFNEATYIEQQPDLISIAKHNFEKLGLKDIHVIESEALAYLQNMRTVDFIYIDPARRDNIGRKTVLIEDCTPNIIEIEELLEKKAKIIAIKLSPMLDITLANNTLRQVSDIYIISHMNECKELLFVKQSQQTTTSLHCVNIMKQKTDIFSFTQQEEKDAYASYAEVIGMYLYEPNTSIIKAGAYKSIGVKYGLEKLNINSHLYTSSEFREDFQGRKFKVRTVTTLNKKDIKENLSHLEKANITTRNFPLSVQELRKRLKLKDGGDAYIFATTLSDNKKVLILCDKL